MKKLSSLLLLFVNILTTPAICQNDWQKGYIIKNTGDTLSGFIDSRTSENLSKSCHFKTSLEEEKQVLNPDQLFGFGFENGNFFISKSIDVSGVNTLVFLEFLINGRADVFHYRDEDDRYFIEMDGKLHELKNTVTEKTIEGAKYQIKGKEYIGILNFLLQEANIQNEISKSKIDSKSLIGIAKKYHETVCPNEICMIYERHSEPTSLSFGLYSGMLFNRFSFGGTVESNYGKGLNIGGRLELQNLLEWQPKIGASLDVAIGTFSNYNLAINKSANALTTSKIIYNDENFVLLRDKSYYNIPPNQASESLDVNIKTIVIRAPLTINYSFKGGNFKPYLGIGIVNMFVLTQNDKFILREFYQEFNQSIPNYHLGYILKVGSKRMLKNNHGVFAEISYEKTSTTDVNEFLRFSNRMAILNVGYIF